MFYVCYQENIDKGLLLHLDDHNFLNLTNSHELLYEGYDPDIKLNETHGYFSDIYILSENGDVDINLENQIKSISISNTDVQIIKNIPVSLLKIKKNLFGYGFTLGDQDNTICTGFKIDEDNWIDVRLEKIIPDMKVKIYGKKLILLQNNTIGNITKTYSLLS